MEYYEDDRHSAVADDFLMCQEEEYTENEAVFSMEMDICVACGGDHLGMVCRVVADASAELERDRDLEYFNSPSSFWSSRQDVVAAVDLLHYQYRAYVDSIPPLELPPSPVTGCSSSSSADLVFVIHERQIKCC